LYNKYGFLPLIENQTDKGFVYRFQGLTDGLAKEIKSFPGVLSMKEEVMPVGEAAIMYKANADRTAYTKNIDSTQSIFPINKNWNQDQYGPLKIPKKGDVVALNQETLPEYRWIISEYEHNHLENKNGKIFINGKETNSYTIQQNYYMMIGDNRDASLDARFSVLFQKRISWENRCLLGSAYKVHLPMPVLPTKLLSKSDGTECSKQPTPARLTKLRIGG
jgi:signal peptidase I